jgi:hypothetical protein
MFGWRFEREQVIKRCYAVDLAERHTERFSDTLKGTVAQVAKGLLYDVQDLDQRVGRIAVSEHGCFNSAPSIIV